MISSSYGACVAALLLATPAAAEVPVGNYFADVYVDGDKSGTVHFSSQRDEDGRIEEVRSDVSISMLGFEVFEFEQHVIEEWEEGELQFFQGRTNDDGDVYEITLRRRDGGYRGRLNAKPVTIPGDAFPVSPWRHELVEHDLLFSVKDLELRDIEVAGPTQETVTVDGEAIATERFDISGDWDATVWYDEAQRLVQVRYAEHGHEIMVVPERERAGTARTN